MKKSILTLLLLISNISIFAQSGHNDPTFNPGSGIAGSVKAIAVQPDGKIIIAGVISQYNGVNRKNIARVTPDGLLDPSFAIGTMGTDNTIAALAIQPDGKIIIGGQFTTYNGTSRNGIARLNIDGSLDLTFNPGTGVPQSGSNLSILAVELQPDGKILIGGYFQSYNGVNRKSIARLNSDGSLDLTFDVGTGISGNVTSIVVKSDTKILLGGSFSYTSNGSNIIRRSLMSINSDGTLDNTIPYTLSEVQNITDADVLADGTILYSRNFSTNGNSHSSLEKYNPNGSGLTIYSFTIFSGDSGGINKILVQPDGKIVIGGWSTSSIHGLTTGIKRFNADFTPDPSFETPNDGVYGGATYAKIIYSLAIQPDGKILLGGSFSSYCGVVRNGIARTVNCGSPETGTDIRSACGYYVWMDGNTYTSNTNIPTHTLTNSSTGCDSTITLNLTMITEIDNTVSVTGGMLQANQTGATYQWLNCDNGNSPVTGVTSSRTFYPSSNGNYAVKITAGTCTETSACTLMSNAGLGLNETKPNPFTLFPNPATSNITIQFQNEIQDDLVTIYSISGQKVLQEKIMAENNQFHVNTSNLQSGIYFVEIGNARMKFVVE